MRITSNTITVYYIFILMYINIINLNYRIPGDNGEEVTNTIYMYIEFELNKYHIRIKMYVVHIIFRYIYMYIFII